MLRMEKKITNKKEGAGEMFCFEEKKCLSGGQMWRWRANKEEEENRCGEAHPNSARQTIRGLALAATHLQYGIHNFISVKDDTNLCLDGDILQNRGKRDRQSIC